MNSRGPTAFRICPSCPPWQPGVQVFLEAPLVFLDFVFFCFASVVVSRWLFASSLMLDLSPLSFTPPSSSPDLDPGSSSPGFYRFSSAITKWPRPILRTVLLPPFILSEGFFARFLFC